jgi:S-adenosylmethionine:tRNA ribosyltransferase-isomerase
VRTAELDFDLPDGLIAQSPAERRADARLLHYRRAGQRVEHRRVLDLPSILQEGDLLVFNHTRVIAARFTLVKGTGGLVEGLWLGGEGRDWQVLLKNVGSARDLVFHADPTVGLRVTRKRDDDGYDVTCTHDAAEVLPRLGRMPLPPYIRRHKGADERDAGDRERYQTVLARDGTSVAAPTAGLHFDETLLAGLEAVGVRHTSIRLDVGLGTFKPVDVDDLDDHPMHRESWHIDPPAAEAIKLTGDAGGRVVAIGTTVCRTLESQPAGPIRPGSGETDLMIRPPYEPRHVDALLTNFHLPRSTLLALVDAFIGTDERRRIYESAIAERYRFFSYGDCMLIG